MEEYGLNVHDVPPQILSMWRAEAEEGYKKLVGPQVPKEIFDEVRTLRDEYRALGITGDEEQ